MSSERKVIIGDNLAAHTSLAVLALCKKYNIKFFLLLPNTSGDTQPLDVGYFRGLKAVCRNLVQHYLKSALRNLETDEHNERNINGEFRGTGIYPVNREEVLKNVPDREKCDVDNIEKCWTAASIQQAIGREASAVIVRRKRTLRSRPGQDVAATLKEEEKTGAIELLDSEGSDRESDVNAEDSDSDEEREGVVEVSETDDEQEERAEDSESEETAMDVVTDKPEIEEGDFIIGKLIYNFGTAKEAARQFVGQVIRKNTGRQDRQTV